MKKCFKYAIYTDDIVFDRVELIGNSDKRSICGTIKLNENKESKDYKGIKLKSNFYWLKDYLGDLFEIVANDDNLYTAHLKNSHDQYLNSTEVRFANIFAAFEAEYKRLPNEIRFNDTTPIEPLRERLLEAISNIQTNKNNTEKKFSWNN